MNKSYSMNIDTGEKKWLTPPEIIRALGLFDLDPCCPPNMPWRTAKQMVHWPDDGLKVEWTGKRVWLNPPYGRESVPFLRKMAENKTGGYRVPLRKDRHEGVARMGISIRVRVSVHARTHKVLLQRRKDTRHVTCAICASRVHGKGFYVYARKRDYRSVFARLVKGQ